MDEQFLTFEATESTGRVSAILQRPESARFLYVLAHGAGAGMRHAFMDSIAEALSARGVATFRYQFPYMEAGRRAPNSRPILLQTVQSAVAEARRLVPDLPIVAGGKSMGGRMTSLAASEMSLPGVMGLIFLGFPLHQARKPSTERGNHLTHVDVPMLFVQGTRDALAELELLNPLVGKLEPQAKMVIIDGGDHSFNIPKSRGRDRTDVLGEIASAIRSFCDLLLR